MTRTIGLTQGMVALVDDDMFDYLNQWKWQAVKSRSMYYARRQNRTGKHIHMHRVILGLGDFDGTNPVDHKNRNGLDNRRANLRLCTLSENQINRNRDKPTRTNKYGLRGVHYESGRKFRNWRAMIRVRGVAKHLGYFDTPEMAHAAYEAARSALCY